MERMINENTNIIPDLINIVMEYVKDEETCKICSAIVVHYNLVYFDKDPICMNCIISIDERKKIINIEEKYTCVCFKYTDDDYSYLYRKASYKIISTHLNTQKHLRHMRRKYIEEMKLENNEILHCYCGFSFLDNEGKLIEEKDYIEHYTNGNSFHIRAKQNIKKVQDFLYTLVKVEKNFFFRVSFREKNKLVVVANKLFITKK